MSVSKSKPADVDAYIANSAKEARSTLREVRQVIKSAIPKFEEGISYGVPFYKYHGQLVGFAAYKNHVSFGFGPGVLQDEERKMLEQKGYTIFKGTMQIKFDQKVPVAAIKQILRTKAKVNKAKGKKT
ncbi:MAG: DUF1801 domain-containing protein [Ilumatobacteraceae bacterium]